MDLSLLSLLVYIRVCPCRVQFSVLIIAFVSLTLANCLDSGFVDRRMNLLSLLSLSAISAIAWAETHFFDWNITWVTANPDGMQPRPVIGINNEWPLPLLNFTKGDRIIANVRNQLGNESTSVHFHGFFQNGTNEMDGPPGVTQCNIPPNETMVYNFTVSPLSLTHLVHADSDASLINPVHIGIIPTRRGSIPTAGAKLW